MGTSVNNKPLTKACVQTATAVIAELAVCTSASGSIDDNTIKFDVYPNPAHDYCRVMLKTRVSEISISDLFARTRILLNSPLGPEINIKMKNLAPGVYILSVIESGRKYRKVIIKQ